MRLVAVAGLILALAGCSSSTVTPANFEKLKPGMSRPEVEAVLGRPAKDSGNPVAKDSGLQMPFTMVRWGDEQRSITVGFDDAGKAAFVWQKGVLEK